MSKYIKQARKNLSSWAETIDIETFTEQYEALNHHSEAVFLEDNNFNMSCTEQMQSAIDTELFTMPTGLGIEGMRKFIKECAKGDK